MAKIDITLWDNPKLMRERIKNLATMVLSITAVNGFYTLSQSQWVIFGINCLFFISTIPVFMSKTKWEKQPPKPENSLDQMKALIKKIEIQEKQNE